MGKKVTLRKAGGERRDVKGVRGAAYRLQDGRDSTGHIRGSSGGTGHYKAEVSTQVIVCGDGGGVLSCACAAQGLSH